MGKKHFSPWDDLEKLFEAAERLREHPSRLLRKSAACGLWTPAADMYETEAGYVIEIELPGIEQEDVVLEATGSGLVVSGQRPAGSRAAAYHALERDCGPFVRSFGLPRDADPEAISAGMKNGVLTISIPRRGEKAQRSIPVR